MKLPAVAPAATATDAGTVSAALLDESATVAPLPWAGSASVTVQVDVALAANEFGVHTRLDTVTNGVTVREALAELPFNAAVNVAV